MENIAKLTQELNESYLRTTERRKQWQTVTRSFLLQQLSAITEKYRLDWKAGVNEAWQNLESVFISFAHTASGIVEKNVFTMAQKVKTGALLSFSQSRNGQIVVWMTYPSIEGLNEDGPKQATLDTMEPEEINEEAVNRHVEKFLDELIQWENNGRDEIGFIKKHR